MGKATPKKLGSPGGPVKTPKIMGVSKEKTPKSEMKQKKVVGATPKADQVTSAKKKKKSMSGAFQVSEMQDEPEPQQEVPTTPLTGKKKKSVVLATPKVLKLVETVENKRKSQMASEAASPVVTPMGKKKKIRPDTPAQPKVPTQKQKKQRVAPVEKPLEPLESPEEEEQVESEPEKEEKKEGEKKGRNKKRSKSKKPKARTTPYTVFVGNLPFEDITSEMVKEHFQKIDLAPTRAHLPTDRKTNLMKGFAFVDLPDNDQYVKALSLDGSFMGKRRLRVQFTTPGNKSKPGRMKVIREKNLKFKALKRKGISLNKGRKSE